MGLTFRRLGAGEARMESGEGSGPGPLVSPVVDEVVRLDEDARREKNWKRFGPYLADRQWGTVREDYSADGSCWTYFPHEHARSARGRRSGAAAEPALAES
jgi:hypothetical protein